MRSNGGAALETAPERPKNFDPLQHCLDCLTVEEEKASVKSSNSKEVVSVTSSESIMKRNGVEEENCFHSTEESMRAHEAETKKNKAAQDRAAAEQMVADYDNDAGVFVALDKADSDEEEEEAAMETTAPEGPSSLNGTGATVPGAVDASEEEQPSSLELLEQMRTVLEAENQQSGEKDLQIMELETTLAELEARNQELMEEVAFKAEECAHARDHLATKGKQFDYLRIAVLAAAKAVVTGPPTTSTTTQAE